MRTRPATALLLLVSAVTSGGEAKAIEYGFSTYGLGGSAFGAGVTAPPGLYATGVTGFYSGQIGGAISFGGVTINAGAQVDGFTGATNFLYVPNRKVLGGNLGLSITVPVGHVDLEATVGVGPLVGSRAVDGWGFGDVVPKVASSLFSVGDVTGAA